MATKKKMLQAAAGNATGGAGGVLNVEDVFSTYLYGGNGSAQAINNGIALADGVGGGTSTKFDGTSDYLQRGSTFTNNTNSKTLTLSFWFRWDDGSNLNERIFGFFGDSTGTNVNAGLAGYISSSDKSIKITHGDNSAFNWVTPNNTIVKGKWTHFLASIDMDTQSNTKFYIDDVAVTGTYLYFGTGTAIKGDTAFNTIGSFWNNQYGQTYKGNLAHFYVDYTWRDLDTTSNRRIFIDADGGSTSASSLAANSPVIYFPMTDNYSLGENAGTGGDLTSYGSPTIVDDGTEYLSGVGEGGLVWLKSRSASDDHLLFDTERGATTKIRTNRDFAQSNDLDTLTAFNANGFSLGADTETNTSAADYASWTFRKAPKFFTCVQYTGDGNASQTISHNLGSIPGHMAVKPTSITGSWRNYHRTIGATGCLLFNLTNATSTTANHWNNTEPTDSSFTVGINSNLSGETYIAYLFAHNDGDGEFGPDGDADIIKCGSYTGTGSAGNFIDLGFEPQWVLYKRTDSDGSWVLQDSMRGMDHTSYDLLYANTSGAELSGTAAAGAKADPRGFTIDLTGGDHNASGGNYIYIAIRRGTKVPESATEVFAIDTEGSSEPYYISGFSVDFGLQKNHIEGGPWFTMSRLTQGRTLKTESDNAEIAEGSAYFDYMNGFVSGAAYGSGNSYGWMWKRAPGYFDVVCYTGTGSARTVSHNLGVAPEMMWVKERSQPENWRVYHKDVGTDAGLSLNLTSGEIASTTFWNNTAPTDTVLSVNSNSTNESSQDYIAYLFASLPGISKVGSYTGTGSDQNIDCGFTSGARFVLIKRYSSTSPWSVFDSARGITSSTTDPYLFLNSTAAEATDAQRDLDPYSSGFTLAGNDTDINASGSSYIFYAIA